MPTDHIVSLLIAERDKLNRAIEALQGEVKRRGRPPKSAGPRIAAPSASAPPASNQAEPVKKRHVSAAARRKMAAAQKKRWAAIKAGK
jgi:hypothetical protein